MSYMKMIYIDSDHQARQTGKGAAMETNEETWRAFRSYRRYEVPIEEAAFLLDYYNRKGELADTIAISAGTFRALVGEPPMTDAEYRELDRDYWQQAMSELREQQKFREVAANGGDGNG